MRAGQVALAARGAIAAVVLGASAAAHAQTPRPAALGDSTRMPLLRPGTPPLQPPAGDRWFAQDKARHFVSSMAIQLMSYGLARLAGASADASLLTATVLSTTAGVGKEIHDARQGGRASLRDLVWDAAGIGAGTVAVRLADRD